MVGSLALVAAYTLLVRSSSIIQLNTDEFIPDQRKKEKFFRKTLNNHFPKTLEEEMVEKLAPVGHSDLSVYSTSSYSPVYENIGSASVI